MAYESAKRFFSPVPISFDEAIIVAMLGLLVNLASALIPREDSPGNQDATKGEDRNLKSAYFHVVADAFTSVLAIIALSAGRFLGWIWMDPVMGMVGAVIIFPWSYGLTRETGRVLLDINPNRRLAHEIKQLIESGMEDRISDLHLWSIGPGHFSAVPSLFTSDPRPPTYYKAKLHHGITQALHRKEGSSPSSVKTNPVFFLVAEVHGNRTHLGGFLCPPHRI